MKQLKCIRHKLSHPSHAEPKVVLKLKLVHFTWREVRELDKQMNGAKTPVRDHRERVGMSDSEISFLLVRCNLFSVEGTCRFYIYALHL